VSRWTRTLRFDLTGVFWSEIDAFTECAASIISRSRALVELDAGFFGLPTERIVAAAVEVAVGTLHRLKLGFAHHTSPAPWAVVSTAVNLRSLNLHTVSDDPFTNWEAVGPWVLPHLKRLELDLNNYENSEDYDGIFTFLGRCELPDLQEIDIYTLALISLGDVPALVRFSSSRPAIIRLTIDGPSSLSNDIIQHALAETVTLHTVPDASAIPCLSLRIHTLEIYTIPLHEKDERRLLAFLEALINDRPLRARLACIKLKLGGKDNMRWAILPLARRLHEQSITLLDANDQRYHV
jgi:hypothetical protein